MLLDAVVRTSAAVAESPGRLAKISLIADLLKQVPTEEISIAVSFLAGDLTQRQIGVGYAALSELMGGYGEAAAAPEVQEESPPEPAAAAMPAPDLEAQADPFDSNGTALRKRYGGKINVRDFDGQPDRLTEMDALVAYLQMLGTLVDFSTYKADATENQR